MAGMMTPISATSFSNMVFNAGILLKNFDYSSATDATSLATLIEAAKKKADGTVMGATKGGININTALTYWEPEADGMRMSFKGAKQLDTAEVTMSGTLVEFTPENVKDALALADISTSGQITTVQPRFDIKTGDYIDSVVWVANKGSDGLVLVDVKNCLCTSGLNMQSTDKDIGTIPFEFAGHADDVSSTELPIKYLFYGVA